jgi:hypothetical protein
MKTPARSLVVLLFLAFFAALSASPGAVLIVTNTQDAGTGSLRDTVSIAATGDTIEFNIPTSDPGYNSATGIFTITLTSSEIVLDKDLNLAAPPRNIAISGNQASRIFNITAGTVTLSDLSLIDGQVRGAYAPSPMESGSAGMGGAVLNQGTLTITRCHFNNNNAVGGGGAGGLASASGGGDGMGGAIANQNFLALVACTFASNSAQGGAGGVAYNSVGTLLQATGGMGTGGAIYNTAAGFLSLTNCTITGNSTVGLNAYLTTIANAGAPAQGGAISNFGGLTMVHCTVANNLSQGGASSPGVFLVQANGGFSNGGGIFSAFGSASVIRDSILAPNNAVGGLSAGPPAVDGIAAGPDVSGDITSEGHNLLGRSDGCTGFIGDDLQGGTTDDTRLDPMLGDLANNGGPTETLALLPGSPAIDHGDLTGPDRDQRYFLRNGPPDIGAYEFDGTQPVMLANISTRLQIGTGANAMIGGFIVTGTESKTVMVRGIGPSLSVAGALADPIIELHGPSGVLLVSNDDWGSAVTSQEILGSGLAPTNALESAWWGSLDPGAYSVVVRGKSDSTGVALFEVYDLDQTVDSKLANVSTRGFVDTGNNVMIGGTIIVGSAPRVLLRAIGPSLSGNGVPSALGNPTLELYDASGQLIAMNDDWRTDHEQEIIATGIPPSDDLESAIVSDLAPGPYTAVVRGKNDATGVALIEVYDLN